MADNISKGSTPPPLLLMPASEGLTLSPSSGGNILMPVPQTEASLLSPEEEAEADSFLGQSPPSQSSQIGGASSPFSYFKQPSSNANSDPFSQVQQPDSLPQFEPRSVADPVPLSQPQSQLPSQSSLISTPAPPGPPPQSNAAPQVSTPASLSGAPPTGATVAHNPHRLAKRPQYAPPPPGTYASPSGVQPVPPPHMGPPPLMSTPQMQPPLPQAPYTSPPPSAAMQPMSPPGPPSTQFPPRPTAHYIPAHHHWFFCKNVGVKQEMWEPFSVADSFKLEEAFSLGETDIVSTDGGRYDVEVSSRQRRSVYWEEDVSTVRRCSWFYRPDDANTFIPYEEDFAFKLEEEYKSALSTDSWHKRLEFPDGETIVMHNPHVIVHFAAAAQPDQWGTTQGVETRPKVVKRGIEDFESIKDGESEQVDHVIFIVHGIGSTCDLRFRNIVECVNDFRNVSQQILDSHFKQHQEGGKIGRVEYLPVRWHNALHGDATGIDKRLKAITLTSINKLRHFTNDTLLDILFYASPTYAQKIADTVCEEINRLHHTFLSRNPGFSGSISVAGHSLGSLILFDLLAHQRESGSDPSEESLPHVSSANVLEVNDLRHSPASSTRTSTPSKELNGEQEDELQTLEQLLERLGLSDYLSTFQQEQIDLESLTLCEESDIKEMGLPMGPRKKLQGFIKQQKHKESRAQVEAESQSRQEADARAKLEAEQQALALEQQRKLAGDPLLPSSSNTSIDYVQAGSGTGAPHVNYPQLNFSPVNFYALGSPIAMFLTVRGVDTLGEEFHFPTCNGFFNIFHPFDPVAYRVEPLVGSNVPPKPMLMPHHKGRKRLHLELRESLARYGTDIKQRIIDSVKSTWKSINNFAMAHRSQPGSPTADPNSTQDMEEEVDSVISQMAREEQDRLESSSIASSMPDEDFLTASLNQGRRVDYVLQEKPIESFNDYLFALGSHLCYWESEDTVLLLLKETYALQGLSPIKPGKDSSLSPQRPPVTFPRPPGGIPPSSIHPPTSFPLPSGPTGPPAEPPIQGSLPVRPPVGYGPGPFMPTSTFPQQSNPSSPPRSANVGPPPMAGFVSRK